jgi:hypothetical protein
MAEGGLLLAVGRVLGVANMCPSVVVAGLGVVLKGNGMRTRSGNEGAVNVRSVSMGRDSLTE